MDHWEVALLALGRPLDINKRENQKLISVAFLRLSLTHIHTSKVHSHILQFSVIRQQIYFMVPGSVIPILQPVF